eukprot:m.488592 g.488592  ORF g.488592 m.488592 type:complete len:467 (-) comp25931_c0_seq1:75-1475(-)
MAASRALCVVALSLLVTVPATCAGTVGVGRTNHANHHRVASSKWDAVTNVLTDEIDNHHSFPGCVAAVAKGANLLYLQPLGNFTYGEAAPMSHGTNPPMASTTNFDMASLTKVLATTTAVMTFYQRGELDLATAVSDDKLLGPDFAAHGKRAITVENLLLHNAGFPPDPSPGFWLPAFGCEQSTHEHPLEVFDCRAAVYRAVLAQTLINPVGQKFVYSDLSMITMMFVVGKLAHDLGYVSADDLNPACHAAGVDLAKGAGQCYYEAYVRIHVLGHVGMTSSGFLPAKATWESIPPTWNDTTGWSPGPGYRHRVVQGQVSDQNAYAMGGIAGHAGLFSNVPDVLRLVHRLLFASPTDAWVNATTVALFTRVHNATQSSRALGWDTNLPGVNTYRGCGNLSATTFTHTGYTGTQVCNDPVRGISTVLLTNRVYPTADDYSEDQIHRARQRFNNAVRDVIDGGIENIEG